MTTDCQGVNRFDRRADSLRRTGGPCLSPLVDVSQRTLGSPNSILTSGGRTTRMKRLRTLGLCGTSERAAQGHGLWAQAVVSSDTLRGSMWCLPIILFECSPRFYAPILK